MVSYIKITTRSISIAIVLLYSLVAYAQAPADLLRRAYELRLAGHDEAALPVLEQAYAMSPTPNVSAQLGLCDEAVGRWEAAEQHLHAALLAPNDPWVARHLQSLEGAYALALAHFPRESSAVPMSGSPTPSNAPSSSPSHAPLVVPLQTQPVSTGGTSVMPVGVPERHASPHPALLRLGYAGVVAGGVVIVGGFAAWIAREMIVSGFNSRGCRVGDPMPAVGCNAAGAESGRDITTSLAATGLVAGGLMELAGLAVVVMHGRAESWPQSRLTIGAGPGDVGASLSVRF